MAHEYTAIDLETWKRKAHCSVFMNAFQPQYCVGFDLDVTHFKAAVEGRGMSFTLAFLFTVARCANRIEEFRYRFRDGNVVLYHEIDTLFTYLDAETELFKVVFAPMRETLDDYVQTARAAAEGQEAYFTGPVGEDVFVCSALPWVRFTHVSHTYFGDKWKAQPLFDWGKFENRDGKWIMPFAVQVHHAFVDGIHIGRLATRLQDDLDAL